MTSRAQIVLGDDIAEDDLRLPRPPGVVRAFWARHPLLADVLIGTMALLVALPTYVFIDNEAPPGGLPSLVGWAMVLVSVGSLLWRRRYPLIVFMIAFTPIVVLSPVYSAAITGVTPAIALYSVAVYRSNRAAMWLLAAAVVINALVANAWALFGTAPVNSVVSLVTGTAVILLIGALIGMNVGSRKRYVEALIERSRQLAIERDQQARLATAAERTRIAREMHDIVSHSLAVVVTLAEGAHATDDLQRSRQASRAIADTARDALSQMRVMLGVLRTEPDAAGGDAPREPLLDLAPQDVVETARAAGVPATLKVTGVPGGDDMQRLAVLRIVQEGLTNAMRYAPDASFVHVETEYSGDRIRVSVENDGSAPSGRSRGAGVGLQGLKERTTGLGGEFAAGRVPPDIWRLTAEFPKEPPRE